LAQVLRPLTIPTHPDLIVGLQTSDDAAVLRISDDLAIVQTLDFFAPVVDDPYEYGAIAAANSMSDVCAMGGTVTMALNVAAFPDDLDLGILGEIFRGGVDKVTEAGGVIAGGHTVTDAEPKYGLSVTGMIHPDRVWTKAGAVPGDVLLLTKPLGSGVLTTAAKQDRIDRDGLAPAIATMLRLNLHARNIAVNHEIHAATDITGFGLAGHAWESADRSGVAIEIELDALPVLPGVLDLLDRGVMAGGLGRNRDHYTAMPGGVTVAADANAARTALAFDPQTSGGLLFAVPADGVDAMVRDFQDAGEAIWPVGSVASGTGLRLGAGESR
jgi:selenide,water dikinase